MVKSMRLAACALTMACLTGCGGAGEPSVTTAEDSAPMAERAPVDGCAIVTQADATALFSQPASPETGHSGVTMRTQCLWTWDTESSNQLLQFHLWDPLAYDLPEDAESLDVGDSGFIRIHPQAGVDIGWLQAGRFVTLAYSTLGPDAPRAPDRAAQMIALARKVENRLQATATN